MTDSATPKDLFIRNEDGEILPIIENFYNYCSQRKLMAVRCTNCNTLTWPPREICPKCFRDKFAWVQLNGDGNLMTYTVIHFPPTQFLALAPYAVGIVKMSEGTQIPGMIRNVKLEGLRIGMRLKVNFETATLKEWPRWTRYFFSPVD